jgi:tetratricopeptide (TPR) repeat protein
MPGQKFNAEEVRKQSRFNKLAGDYRRAVFSGKGAAETDAMIAPAKGLAPADFNLDEFKQTTRLQYAFQQYLTEATGNGDDAKLATLAAKLDVGQSKQALLLNEMAWTLLTEGRIKKRDLPLATKLAKAAYDACEGKEATIVDTYARALADSGRLDEAITYQKRAVDLAQDEGLKTDLAASLKKYQDRRRGVSQ